MGGKGGGRIGRCELQAHEEGGETDKGGYRGAGIGAPGACCVVPRTFVGRPNVVANIWGTNAFIGQPTSFA